MTKNNRIGKFIPTSTVILFLIFLTYFILDYVFLLKLPSIWPDEVIYVDIVTNLIDKGQMASHLWQDMMAGVHIHAFWNPPFFFYLLAGWMKLTRISIGSQRLLSVLAGSGFLFFYILVSKIIFRKHHLLYILPSFFLVFDLNFMNASRISRPEIFVLFFGFASYYFYLKSLENAQKRMPYLAISSLASSLAFLMHTIGVFFVVGFFVNLLVSTKKYKLSFKKIVLLCSIFTSVSALWLIQIIPHFSVFKTQMILASEIKRAEPIRFFQSLLYDPIFMRVILWGYVIVMAAVVLQLLFFRKTSFPSHLVVYSLFAWSASLYGKMIWYMVLPIPFAYLLLAYLLSTTSKPLLKLMSALTLIFLLLNLNVTYQFLKLFKGTNYSYYLYSKNILDAIPPGKSVFLSAIPDPYYPLKKRGQNVLYEFPALRISRKSYLKLLDDSDYIIFTNIYNVLPNGFLLADYIKVNGEKFYTVDEPNQNRVVFIKLVDRSKRKLVK